jgi:hypothetical protein
MELKKITLEEITAKIVETHYWIVPNSTVTVCAITLTNGFTVTGKSGTVSEQFFDEDIGKQVALNNAVQEIWAAEGYLMRQKLYEAGIK